MAINPSKRGFTFEALDDLPFCCGVPYRVSALYTIPAAKTEVSLDLQVLISFQEEKENLKFVSEMCSSRYQEIATCQERPSISGL